MAVPVVSELYNKFQEAQKYADPRTKDWPMLWSNPIPVWILTASYLVFVLYAGPRFMQNRKPYSLQGFMVVYNLGLVVMSTWMFIEIILSITALEYNWLCAPYNEETRKDPREYRLANILWYYGISKAIELMDTVLMVLRKKNNQITFLHVFHHATMLNIWWWVPTFIPGGQTWFGSCLNCLVHVVMYSYYGLAVIPSLRDKLWWKKYITTFQLVQFVITFSHSAQTYVTGCDFPLWGQYLLMGYMLIMLCLFGNFYIQSYINRKSKSHPKKTDTNGHISESWEQNGTANGNGKYVNRNSKSHKNGVVKRH
uniref:Elongation of very long chain fatty acids protein n=1 Tax=Sinonovacula constricta TaxID=98310 RepID=A0A4Y5JSY5_SINCO|nr:Elovl2/5 [Sinonovacula constricta]